MTPEQEMEEIQVKDKVRKAVQKIGYAICNHSTMENCIGIVFHDKSSTALVQAIRRGK